jgi:hypothetical protein
MPTMTKIEVDPAFKAATEDQKRALADAKKAGQIEVDLSTAIDNIKLSGGMYRLVQDEAVQIEAVKPRTLDDFGNDELKVMLLNLGIKTEKRMTRDQIISLIRTRLDTIEVVEEGPIEG